MGSMSSTATIELSRLHWPVTTLGYGRRIGVWFQGCAIACPGCCARDTWPSDASRAVAVPQVLEWMRARAPEADGFTITGGEPFDQPDALEGLLVGIRERFAATGERDIIVFSGYPWRRLRRHHAALLQLADVVISGPYRRARAAAYLRGSDNQRIDLLSELARCRYAQRLHDAARNALQVGTDQAGLWLIGIPERGDLLRLEARLAKAGITLDQVSWREPGATVSDPGPARADRRVAR